VLDDADETDEPCGRWVDGRFIARGKPEAT
jgi:hypothetical protein